MKLFISDACIFLDLFELGLIDEFLSLEYEVHTSLEVLNELFPNQREQLVSHGGSQKLSVHSFKENDWLAMSAKKYPNTVCHNDKVSLYLSEKYNCILLSSDKVVRQLAKRRSIEHHALIWTVERMLENNKIIGTDAIQKITQLIKTNKIHQQNTDLINELNRRTTSWQRMVVATR